MNEKTENPAGLSDTSTSSFDSTDPVYLEWVARKIDTGLSDLKSPAKRTSEADLWKEFGVAD